MVPKSPPSSPSSSSSSHSSIDQTSGFNYHTKTYHSLRPHLPVPDTPSSLSVTDYIFNLHRHSPTTTAFLIDGATRHRIPFSQLQSHVTALAHSLRHRVGLSKGDTAFIISPNSLHVPVLYLSLLSIGVVVSPSNPASSVPEVARQIQLSNPVIAFATSDNVHKLPSLRHRPILIDSPEFDSLLSTPTGDSDQSGVGVLQADTAAVLYSSGTTGKVKGVALTHWNLISVINGAIGLRQERSSPAVGMCTVPFFHVYGFIYSLRTVAFGESLVVIKKFDLALMMRCIQEFRVTHLALAPPVVVAMVNNSSQGYDLSSLEVVLCGGAPLSVELLRRFNTLFPNVPVLQAYGLTETGGGVTRTIGPFESKRLGASGRLVSNCQAKIVDPETGTALPPMEQGELWVKGPFIMKGYVNDEEASSSILTLDGWLKTGDLCYFDNEGFLFCVDRLKELIKCNGYQVPPAELEDLLQSHPDIVDAAVVPYPDDKAGQVPIAFVVRKLGSAIDESRIMDFVAKQVAPYKKLRHVSFIDAIPKNATGKVLRKELVKIALSNVMSRL